MKTINTIVLSGGGILGLTYCGVFKKLHEISHNDKIKIDIKRICGTSVGSIFGLLYTIGYTYVELEEEIIKKNFLQLRDTNLSNLFSKFGFDTGKNFIGWIQTLLLKKKLHINITFKELFSITGIWFQVVTTNLTKLELSIFDHINSPDTEVTKAIRCSISLPFLFTYEEYDKDIYLDGGIICNYPITIINEKDIENTVGIVVNPCEFFKSKTNNIINYIYSILSCYNFRESLEIEKKYKTNTIFMHNDDIDNTSLVNFSLKSDTKKKLFDIGYKCSNKYFEEFLN